MKGPAQALAAIPNPSQTGPQKTFLVFDAPQAAQLPSLQSTVVLRAKTLGVHCRMAGAIQSLKGRDLETDLHPAAVASFLLRSNHRTHSQSPPRAAVASCFLRSALFLTHPQTTRQQLWTSVLQKPHVPQQFQLTVVGSMDAPQAANQKTLKHLVARHQQTMTSIPKG